MNEEDLKRIWLRQPVTGTPTPGGPAEMNQKMRRFDRQIFWRDVRELAAGVLIIVWFSWYFARYTGALARLGCLLVIASSVFIDWKLIRGKLQAGRAAPDAPVLEVLRVEWRKVTTQIGLLRNVLWWYLLPLATGVSVFQFGIISDPLRRSVSVFVWAVVMVVVDWVNQYAVRKSLLPLQTELETLLGLPPQSSHPMKKNQFKNMFLLLLMLGALAALLWNAARAAASEPPPAEPQIEAMLTTCVDKQRRAPGIVIAVADKQGTRFYARGWRDRSSNQPVEADTLFEIGSITKVFTAEVLQAMVEKGEVRLDDPIEKFLPPNVKTPQRDGRHITLLSLATQTSGLPRLPDNLNPADPNNPYADYTVEQLYDFLARCELTSDIGRKYEYSNLGGGLLGQVLALRASLSYEALVVKTICEPLGLASTRITLTPELKARLAPGHDRDGERAANWDIPVLAGAGALRSTARDLAVFVAANARLADSSLSHVMLECQQPRESTGPFGKIGLMWQIDTLHKTIWHNGGTGGYRSYIGFKADGSRGVVVLANSANSVDDLGQYLLGDKAKVDDFKLTKARRAIQLPREVLEAYVGQYKFSLAPVTITATRDGNRFYIQMTGQERLEFFPESQTDFFTKVVDAQLTFVTNGASQATAVVLHQNGIDQTAKRIGPP